ncbi:Ctf8-domain-containing protein [Baffinella frigidus]|nr:Ctf8-domain-containing protein [Cryptophyta sp. CCMP2293]|mmetsp:Transcript_5439/g.13180  ORF Transcript_5439/g.13180 Transcript_5439/m.13180 type:complete len:151 (+) Transcript_5439:88-540(+)|eukprot:CAMPEP_0180146944 /NCGR_PEP_ID=MMETSP0986-20121125/18905_1 /TAXON_ID=697907 /ORGANISM="non described non described, Strain CCMP2293" /LENGTH=150 /DNA_ID=CAMNT_0022092285 /DNA_START=88 /DNA_END=540 /DNA_ORIENTATION=-
MGIGGNASADAVRQVMVRTVLDGPREWSMIEFQGVMEMREEGGVVDGSTIGEMTCKEDKKHVSLLIGNQRLDGKVHDLKQPFAVMAKRRLPSAEGDEEAMVVPGPGAPKGEVELEIVGFIQRKIVFTLRPTVMTASWKSPTKDLGSQAVI